MAIQVTSLLQSRVSIVLLSVFIVLQLFLLVGNRNAHPRSWGSQAAAVDDAVAENGEELRETYHVDLAAKPIWDASLDTTSIWAFNSTRDARNHALSSSECSLAFPQLYHEINRSVQYWRNRDHKLTPQDTNISWTGRGGLRALIYENELRILETVDTHHYTDRHDARRVMFTLSQINRALLGATARGEPLPNIEFAIALNDHAELPEDEADTHTVWTFARKLSSRKDERMWLMPDFNFWAWNPIRNAYQDARRRTMSHDSPLEQKIPKAIWRGNRHINSKLRDALIQSGAGKEWADFEGDWLDIDDFCRYMFSVYTEGHSWSGRMKYMLNCDSLTIVHEPEFTTFYHHLLKAGGPEQNHVRVNRDWSDLEEQVQHYIRHPEEAKRIIENSVELFRDRYVTPAAEACYWRELFKRYRDVSYEPEAFATKTIERFGKKEKVMHLKGIPYELFIGIDGVEKPGVFPP